MKIQLLIAAEKKDYADHLSHVLTEKKSDVFDVSVCSSFDSLSELLSRKHFDVALLDGKMAEAANLSSIKLPLLLWDGQEETEGKSKELTKIRKYQRISSISSSVVEQFALISSRRDSLIPGKSTITAVWSPAGGSGKTTVALAYAKKAYKDGRKVLYIDLEPFCATSVFFKDPGNSISVLFEKLNGDISLLFQGMCRLDTSSGISYFGAPQNYDDINILTEEEIELLLRGGCANFDELVVDLGNACTGQIQRVLNLADKILLVSDQSVVCKTKCNQFRTQHNFYKKIQDKLVVVANKGAQNVGVGGEMIMSLPKVDSEDPVVVFNTLSGYIK